MPIGVGLLILFFIGRALGRIRWGVHFSRLFYLILVLHCRILCKPIPRGYYLDKTGVWKIVKDD